MTVWDVTSLSYEPVEVISIRLMELSGVVDRHVLVESPETFSGMPRDIRWPELAGHPLLAPFAGRVSHVVCEPSGSGAWEREYAQRRFGVTAADRLGCASDDVVVLGDLDEIPHPNAVLLGADRASFGLVTRCVTTYRQYAVDLVAVGSPGYRWEHHQPLVASRAVVGEDAQAFRASQPVDEARLPYGWHLTSQGSADNIALKMRSYAHTECAGMTAQEIAEKIIHRRDILDRCELVVTDDVPVSAAQFPNLMYEAAAANAWAWVVFPG